MAQSRYVLGEVRRSRTEFQQAIEEYSAAKITAAFTRSGAGMESPLRSRPDTGGDRKSRRISAYENAIRIIGERSGISEERYRAGYMENRYQVYVSLVELLLKLGKPGDCFSTQKNSAHAPILINWAPLLRLRRFSRTAANSRAQRADSSPAPCDPKEEYAVPEKERRGQALELYSAELAAPGETTRNFWTMVETQSLIPEPK